jgi:hypothetical protein
MESRGNTAREGLQDLTPERVKETHIRDALFGANGFRVFAHQMRRNEEWLALNVHCKR